jgi:hypothetical protein
MMTLAPALGTDLLAPELAAGRSLTLEQAVTAAEASLPEWRPVPAREAIIGG